MSDEQYERLLWKMKRDDFSGPLPTALDDYNKYIKDNLMNPEVRAQKGIIAPNMFMYHDAVFMEGENVPSIDLPLLEANEKSLLEQYRERNN